MQDLRQTRRRRALVFERLPQRDLIPFRLRLHAKFVAFERNPDSNRIVQLILIVL